MEEGDLHGGYGGEQGKGGHFDVTVVLIPRRDSWNVISRDMLSTPLGEAVRTEYGHAVGDGMIENLGARVLRRSCATIGHTRDSTRPGVYSLSAYVDILAATFFFF